MSTLKPTEPVGTGLRRIASQQVESAIRALTRQPGRADDAVEAIAAARAILALLEPALPRASVRRDNALLDRLIEGLDEMTRPGLMLARLNSQHKKAPSDAALATAVKAMRKQWNRQDRPGQAMNSPSGSFDPAIYRLVADMAELRGHVGEWPIEKIDNAAPPSGLRRGYTRARRLADALATPGDVQALIHALSVLQAQLGVISKACPSMIKAHRKLIARANDTLIDLHERYLLDKALRKKAGLPQPDRRTLLSAVHKAIPTEVAPALAESPASLNNRLGIYWSVWKNSTP